MTTTPPPSPLAPTAGLQVEAGFEGLVLTAWADPAAAVRWALSVSNSCLQADWPTELLANVRGARHALLLLLLLLLPPRVHHS